MWVQTILGGYMPINIYKNNTHSLKAYVDAVSRQKVVASSIIFLAGISLFAAPVVFSQLSHSNSQVDKSVSDDVPQLSNDQSDVKDSIAQPQNTNGHASVEPNIKSGNSSSSISVQSTITNSSGNVTKKESRSVEQTQDGQRKETVVKESDDGKSSVKFNISTNTGADSDVRVRDNSSGNIDIRVRERTEID